MHNLSFHRSMYISDSELRCRLAPRHHLTLYHEKAEKLGQAPRGRDADRPAADFLPDRGSADSL